MAESIIIKGALGINNKIDPLRHQYNPDTGVGFLASAVDCDIDDSGMISRRLGQLEISNLSFLTIFCDKADCFVVVNRTDDAALMQLSTSLLLTGIRSSMTKDERPGFCQVGNKTYYSSRYQNGVIENGISKVWPGSTHLGLETSKVFYDAPLGQHIAYFDGHMLIAQENVIWISEKYEPGKFRMKRNFFQMGTDIRMIKPVLNGLWISDQEKIGFVPLLQGQPLVNSPLLPRAFFPAHEWSDNIELVDLSKTELQIPGMSAVWSSDEGLCVGSEDGKLTITTKEKLHYSTGDLGATVIDGYNVINSVW